MLLTLMVAVSAKMSQRARGDISKSGLLAIGIILVAGAIGFGLWNGGTFETEHAESRTEKAALDAGKPGPSSADSSIAANSVRTDRLSAKASQAIAQSKAARDLGAQSDPQERLLMLNERFLNLTPMEATQIFPVLAIDPSPVVREAGVDLIGLRPDAESQEEFLESQDEFLINMLEDPNERVRNVAFNKVSEREVDERVRLLSQVLNSSNEETREMVLESMAMYRTKASIDALIQNVSGRMNREIQSEFLSAINQSLSQQFPTTDQAIEWWRANQERFTDDMSLAQ